MALSDIKARNATVPEGKKQVKLADSDGMYLLVKPKGKYWRLDYRFNGKRKTLALGTYPSITLKQARKKRDEAKQQLEQGLDPSSERQLAKNFNNESFEAISREWFSKFSPSWSPAGLERDIFPWLGNPSPIPLLPLSCYRLLGALKAEVRWKLLTKPCRPVDKCSGTP